MLKINFYPESDNPNFEKAALEYKNIWKSEGVKIQATIQKISDLKFKEKLINAVIYDNFSYSIPLRLKSNSSLENKKGTLIHELCHRLVVGNNVKIPFSRKDPKWRIEIHKLIDLILYDIWVEIYGEEFAEKHIEQEISIWNGEGESPYKIAWDWALSMSKMNRADKFKTYF